MQVLKITEDGESACYVTALNRSAYADSSLITGSDKVKINDANYTYTRLDDPVVDRSFLTKKALDLCKDIPLNWIVKRCDTQNDEDVKGQRVKRAWCFWVRVCFRYGCIYVRKCW
jgi:hypothetical protein